MGPRPEDPWDSRLKCRRRTSTTHPDALDSVVDTLAERIDAFLDGSPHAVAGASNDRAKFGNKVLRAYLRHERPAYPVNPTESEIEGRKAYPTLKDLPEVPHGVSIITPPPITERLVDDALEIGVKHIWMQPGAESEAAVQRAIAAGANVIAGGPCLLVELAR